jgi:hypothetical protein
MSNNVCDKLFVSGLAEVECVKDVKSRQRCIKLSTVVYLPLLVVKIHSRLEIQHHSQPINLITQKR